MADDEFYRLKLVLEMQDHVTSGLDKPNKKVESFEAQTKRLQKALEKVGGVKAEPKVLVNALRAESQLDRTERMLHKVDRIVVHPKIDLDDQTAGKAGRVQSRLKKLTGQAWKVTVGIKDEVSGKLTGMKNALASPVGMLGMGAATLGAGGFLVDSAQKTMDFSYQISNIQALTGTTGAQLEAVRKKALDLGAATQFSSIEAAQGMTELLKAGLSVEDVLGGASEAALNLAAAGELTLPEAAEIMSTAMNAFHMKDAAHAADVLAGAANASATDVHELRYSLSMCSAVAAGVGMSFDDANTALAVFAQNGFKGSDAGTSLKTMLSRLEPMTKNQIGAFQELGLITEQGTSAFYDSEGRMKSLADIAGLLHERMGDLTNEQQQRLLYEMFGSDALRGGMILLHEGADGVKKMHDEMTKYTASDVARVKWDNAKGDIVRLESAFQNFQITALAPLEPAISKISKALTDFFAGSAEGAAQSVAEVSQSISDFIDELSGDEAFQNMDWGDKIVYVLDRMMGAIDKWAGGPGGEQFGKVMTKLAEIGMRAFAAAIVGLMKGALNALMNGNIAGAGGLALGASMLGGGAVIRGGYKLARGATSLLAETGPARKAAGIYESATSLAHESGSGSIMSRVKGASFSAEMIGGRLFGGLAKSPIFKAASKLAAPVGMAIDAYGVYKANNKAEAAGGMAGRWGGMALGAKAGAAVGGGVGAGFLGIGAAPGAAIGGLLGGLGGFFAGDKLGAMIGKAAAALDFGPIKEKIIAEKDEITEAAGQWFDSLPEKLGYIVGYAATTLAGLPGAAADYFSQLVTDAESYMSELPGRIAAWWQQTETDAVTFASNIVTDVEQFFANLPTIAEQKWSELYNAVTNWCSNTIAGIKSWFSQIPGIIGGYFDSAISAVKNKAGGLWGNFKIGFNAGATAAGGHAEGGIFNQEHIARFAEGGKAEAVVPLDASMRTQGLSIWQQAGQMLGINADMFANAGVGGPYQPAYAAAGSGSGGYAGGDGGSSNAFSFPGMNIHIGNNKSQDEMAMEIGRRILAEIEQSFENRE